MQDLLTLSYIGGRGRITFLGFLNNSKNVWFRLWITHGFQSRLIGNSFTKSGDDGYIKLGIKQKASLNSQTKCYTRNTVTRNAIESNNHVSMKTFLRQI